MDRRWTSHILDPEEKKKFTSYLLSSRTALDRLEEILIQIELEIEDKELDESRYAEACWSHHSADITGQRRMLRKILRLINLDPKDP